MVNKEWIRNIFKTSKPIIGMIHLLPLPGSAFYDGDFYKILKQAVNEAKVLEKAGVDGLQVENMWDHPYLKDKHIGHETTASLTVATYEVINQVGIPVGVNCHLNGNIQAMAAAVASGAKWIRAFELVNAYISNAGIIEASAPFLMRYRRLIGGDDIKILGDVLVKHGSHFITSDRDIGEQAHDIEAVKGDAVIVTGGSTGQKPSVEDINAVKNAVSIPIFVGSGLTSENINEFISIIDGAIVGSEFKEDGKWQNSVSYERAKKFMDIVKPKRD